MKIEILVAITQIKYSEKVFFGLLGLDLFIIHCLNKFIYTIGGYTYYFH